MPAKPKKPAPPPKKSPARASARSTVSGSRRGTSAARGRRSGRREARRHRRLSPRPCRSTRTRRPSMAPSRAIRRRARTRRRRTRPRPAARSARRSASAKVGRGKPQERLGVNPGEPAARPRAGGFERPGAHHQPGRSDRRQPELAKGGAARAHAHGGLHPPREDHPLRPRADPRAHRAREGLGRARVLRVHRAPDRASPARRSSRRRASARRSSCASRRSRASAARRTLPATCAASP